LLIPSGVVEFYLTGNILLGSALLDGNGNAILSTGAIPGGSTTVYAEYEGFTGFGTSTGSFVQVVDKATPSLELATAQPDSVVGEAVTFIGSVLPADPAALIPTGTATFYDETTETVLATDVLW